MQENEFPKQEKTMCCELFSLEFYEHMPNFEAYSVVTTQPS
jgi:hypothetical protein